MTRKTVPAAAAAVLMALSVLVAAPTAGAAAATMTITPSTGLVDGQVVSVVVTGLTPNTLGGMAQCAGGYGYEGCDSSALQLEDVDGSGGFTADYSVQAILHTPAGTFDCREAVSACVLAANTTYATEGAAITPISFDPSGPLLPPPTIAVTPSTDLVDRQAVTLTGEHFRPNRAVAVRQCVGGASEPLQCRQSYSQPAITVGPDGTLSTTFGVRAILHADDGSTIDCRSAAGACELQAGPYDPAAPQATAALTFDPDAPLAPAPTLTATPSTGLVDGQAVTASGAGFMPSTLVGVSECATTPSLATCRSGRVAMADTTGAFSVAVDLRTRFWAGEILDCRDPAVECTLQAYGFEEPDDVAVTALAFDPDGPLLPPPTLVATPGTDLVDGQTVALTGSGLEVPILPIFSADHAVHPPSARWVRPATTSADEPSSTAWIQQCIAGTTDSRSCSQFFTDATVDAEGDLSGEAQVWATFTAYDGQEIDCRSQACELRTGYGDPLTTAIAPLSFDPDAPLAPAPTITVTPTSGLVAGETLHVVGDGFPAWATITFHQCRSGQTGLSGCDTDLVGIASADQNGHVEATTAAKQVLSLGTDGNPSSVTYDCASAPSSCRLLMSNGFGSAKWNQVTLDYVGSNTTAPPPADPAAEVLAVAAFTG
jgi:hypothetical protein